MKIAVLLKQVPDTEIVELGPDGRLRRDGAGVRMNPWCRRALATAVALVSEHGGTCTAYTLGPPAARAVLQEAVAAGADGAVHLSDPAFAGSDTLATARALAGALGADGPWDLVLAGQASVDADTGQVPPQVAELLNLPFLGAASELQVLGGSAAVRCELDDGWQRATAALPALVSVAERIIAPISVPAEARDAVGADRLRMVSATELGPGPWGAAASRTDVGVVTASRPQRLAIRPGGTTGEQAAVAADLLARRGLLAPGGRGITPPHPAGPSRLPGTAPASSAVVPDASDRGPSDPGPGRLVIALLEPGEPGTAAAVVRQAAHAARAAGALTVAAGPALADGTDLAAWGADSGIALAGVSTEEDVAEVLARWIDEHDVWAVVAASTAWGRHTMARLGVRCDAGLTGDALDIHVAADRLVCTKPAFGGRATASVTATSRLQLVTIRPDPIPPHRASTPRSSAASADRPGAAASPAPVQVISGSPRDRVRLGEAVRDPRAGALARAGTVVCVGAGVAPEEYGLLDPLLALLGAQLGATRKVTDRGWLPRSLQVGVTGRTVAPALYVGVGLSGRPNHLLGAARAGTIVLITLDAAAPGLDHADVGLVGDWHDVVPALVEAIGGLRPGQLAPPTAAADPAPAPAG